MSRPFLLWKDSELAAAQDIVAARLHEWCALEFPGLAARASLARAPGPASVPGPWHPAGLALQVRITPDALQQLARHWAQAAGDASEAWRHPLVENWMHSGLRQLADALFPPGAAAETVPVEALFAKGSGALLAEIDIAGIALSLTVGRTRVAALMPPRTRAPTAGALRARSEAVARAPTRIHAAFDAAHVALGRLAQLHVSNVLVLDHGVMDPVGLLDGAGARLGSARVGRHAGRRALRIETRCPAP
ncbi:MAG TPA: FliM/FliN family flagellar motor C-terminal domain-containing protein [Candidatus Binatia bacterium]|nr:FliM/FliN family flagellar motor C-terminal domain-containing protein [Candidatus Binatia bacterium]